MKLSGLVVVAGLAGSVLAQAQPREIPGSMEFSGRLIAKPVQIETLSDRGLSPDQIGDTIRQAQALLARYVEHWYEPLVDHHTIVIPDGMTEAQLIADLSATGLFEFVEPDWILYPVDCPNDPRLSNQWHHDADIMQSCDAWAIHTGLPSVGVGICDTGVETTHPDLQLHRLEGYNAVDKKWESQGGRITPVASHGTETTGCAAANGDNAVGVSGTGWNLSHRMMRVSNSGGSSSLTTLTHAALTSIQAGDKVANVSYSGVNSASVRSTASTIKGLGGLLVWSAGNDGARLNWGNRDADDVIVVGATTGADVKSSFSAYGPSVDLMAPGSNVHTTTTGARYGNVSGTSFSAPLTAGLIGLIWSHNPGLTPDEVEAVLKAGCDDLGSSGIDDTYGHGRINSFNSLSLVGGGPPRYPFLETFEENTLNENVWADNTGGVVSTDGTNEPTSPYALNLDGADAVETANLDLSSVGETPYFSFYTQHKGVESGKTLTVEYRDITGVWQTLLTVVSDGASQTDFSYHIAEIPVFGWWPEFALRISAQGASGDDDWFIDNISVAPFTGNPLPFVEEFPDTSFDSLVWDSVSGGVISQDATGEPSDPYSMNLDGTDSATSNTFLMASADFPSYFSFYTQHKGVENGKQLVVEYLNDSGSWANFMTITSDGVDQSRFEFHQNHLIFDAYHDGFAIRFRALGADSGDDWYIDDIRLGDEFTPPDDCVADFNDDGSVSTQDVLAFLNAWNNGDASADINGDGDVNTQDVLLYLNLWNAGC